MSDFFSFEYFDELPDGDNSLDQDSGSSRRNLSLSMAAAEYLRDAVQRLVPSSYMYGESGIGERAYELYGMCVSHALTGKRSNKLIAALCIMHASYERKTDLVILPTDIETKFANLRMRQLRLTNILSVYDDICRFLSLPRLEPPMEKVLHRVFRQGCGIESESDIFQFVETALRFEKEIRGVVESKPDKPRKKANYRNQFRTETVAAVCAILALRYHNYTKATAKSIETELHVSKGSVHYLLNKVKTKIPPPGTAESQSSPKKRRNEPLYIGGLDIPSGVAKRRRDSGKPKEEKEEILAIVPAVEQLKPLSLCPDADDPLNFLYDLGDPLTTNPSPVGAHKEDGFLMLTTRVEKRGESTQLTTEENGGSSRSSGWSDLLS
jgi:hypothetical protein